jgi:hypothetical protein
MLMEYENVTQKVFLHMESMLQNAKQLYLERLSWHVKFENFRPRKPDNNLESHCMFNK